jgi:Tol biopolymer transport system component/DNA-binding winged helix-turn-helix (wHTH) protein
MLSGPIVLKSRQLRRSRGHEASGLRVYEFDPTTRDVRKNGLKVRRLTLQEATVLALLVTEAPNVVRSEQISSELWPALAPGDWDQRIRDLVQRVRAVLNDPAKKPQFIETVLGVGYMFVGTADGPTKPPLAEPEAVQLPSVSPADRLRKVRRRKLVWILSGLGLATVVVAWYFLGWREVPSLQSRALMPNSPERRIVTAAISPDAKYFAYADEKGAYVFVLDSKETHELLLPAGEAPLHISWFPSSTKLLIVTDDRTRQRSTLREASILIGGTLGPAIQTDVGEAVVSPDDATFAYTSRTGEHLYVQQFGDVEPRLLITADQGEAFRNLSWTGKGKLVVGRVRFGGSSYTVSIDLVNTETRAVARLVSDARLSSGFALPDGSLLFSTVDSVGSEILAADIDLARGRLRSSPRSITRSSETAVYAVTASKDGRKIVYLQGPFQADVYTAAMDRMPRPHLQHPLRLTLEDSNDFPTAWSHEGDAIVFHSDRRGSWEIFVQKIGQSEAKVIVTGPDDYKGARFTSDGKWLLFVAYPRSGKSGSPAMTKLRATGANLHVQIIRMPASGGPRQTLMTGVALSFRCPSGRMAYCVVCEPGLTGGLTFSELDPESGQITRRRTVPGSSPAYWDVSPDAREVAIALSRGRDGLIQRIDLRSGSSRDVIVKGQPVLQSMDWNPDGNGWFVSSRWTHGADLLYVDPQGSHTTLRHQPVGFETWALPDADGHRLAFLEWSAAGSPRLLTR